LSLLSGFELWCHFKRVTVNMQENCNSFVALSSNNLNHLKIYTISINPFNTDSSKTRLHKVYVTITDMYNCK